MLNFYDDNGRYIGRRERIDNELIPYNATETSLEISDGCEARYVDGKWVVTEIMPDASTAMPAQETTLEVRLSKVEALVSGTPSYGELLEAVNILLGE